MRSFFVKIHDYLMRHRVATFVVLAILVILQVLAGLRMGYKEDVSDFLPRDEENARYMSVYETLGGQGTITVIFEGKSGDADERHYAIVDAVEKFESICDSIASAEGETLGLRCHVDETAALEAMGYIREHTALFLSDEDYARIDSLLAIEGYIDSSLAGVRRLMAYPMGPVAMTAVASDPLSLFSPTLRRLEGLGPSDSFVLEDEDKEHIGELYLADDDTIIVGGDLMENLDNDLDNFLNDLLKE